MMGKTSAAILRRQETNASWTNRMYRKNLINLLTEAPRSVSSIARELGLKRGDVDDDLRHALRSAQAAGHRVVIEPARCRTCGFEFATDRLSKPGKCPACRGTRLLEAQIRVEPASREHEE